MKLYQLFIIGTVAISMAACSYTDESVAVRDNPDVITINPYIQNTTRSISKETFENGDVIGLNACRTTGLYSNVFVSNFMDNVAVTKGEDGDWGYSPLVKWPYDTGERISFSAFYPRNEASDATALSYPMTVNTDMDNQVDALWCTVKDAYIDDRNGTAINGNTTDAAFEAATGSIPLKFKHMLSKVSFKVKLGTAYSGITAHLDNMTINGVYVNGTFNISDDLASGSWNLAGSSRTNFVIHDDTDAPKEITTAETNVGTTLMIPQPVWVDPTATVSITYTHTLKEGGTNTVTKELPLTNTWLMDKAYNYIITLSLDVNNIKVSSELVDWDDPEVVPSVGSSNAEAVDLGLSVKWADRNFGASNPEASGRYYAYGEVGTKSSYAWANYKWGTTATTLTKYCTSSANGTVDGKTQLEAADDVVITQWGGNWRMPTYDELKELVDNCTWIWTSLNGVNGCYVVGSTGNRIFLPALGYYNTNTLTNNTAAPYGYYLSSTITNSSYGVWKLTVASEASCDGILRCYGLLIRPVYDNQ